MGFFGSSSDAISFFFLFSVYFVMRLNDLFAQLISFLRVNDPSSSFACDSSSRTPSIYQFPVETRIQTI